MVIKVKKILKVIIYHKLRCIAVKQFYLFKNTKHF